MGVDYCTPAVWRHLGHLRIGAVSDGDFKQIAESSPGHVITKVFDSKSFVPSSHSRWGSVNVHC